MQSGEFDRAWPWLEASLKRDIETHGKEDVRAMCEHGAAQFWAGENCALVTVIQDFPKAKIIIGWLAGGDLNEIRQKVPLIELWAKAHGCTHVQIAARRGWRRAFAGYRADAELMTKGL